MGENQGRTSLSEGQLAIMNVVWDRGEVLVADVDRELAQQRDVARNTVLTMIQRLYERGWLKHRRRGNAYLYRAAVARDATRAGLLRRLLDSAFQGSAEGLVMTLLNEQQLTPDEARRIRERLDDSAEK